MVGHRLLLTRSDLWEDQKKAIQFLYEKDNALLFADIGTGKTVIALTVMQQWLREGVADRVLVVAPKRVCTDVWVQECDEWSHLDTHIACLAGRDAGTRARVLEQGKGLGPDIVLINYENLPWLLKTYPKGVPDFNVLWFDEVDKMKAPGSLRFKGRGRKNSRTFMPGVRHWRENFEIVIGMTGTPVSNGLLDLWAQVYCIDGGRRLGQYITHYRREYFYQKDRQGFKWEPFPTALENINRALVDITFRLESKRKEEVIYTKPRYVNLPSGVLKKYKQMERDYITEFKSPPDLDSQSYSVVALNAGVAYGKLRQMTAGFVYKSEDEEGAITLHDKKYRELKQLVSELNGQQLIVVYQFKQQLEDLQKLFGKRLQTLDAPGEFDRWNSGALQLLAIQPQSAGHGLNLQKSGAHHICFLTEPESAGLYNQVVGRLARTGQTNTVFVHTIYARDTVDEDRAEVVNSKRTTLAATLDAIKRRQKERDL